MKHLGLLFLAASISARADEGVQRVFDCMQANVPQSLRVQDVELETTGHQGRADVIQGRLFAMQDKSLDGRSNTNAMFAIRGPSTLAGAAYLIRQAANDDGAEMYVYLPAVGRVRRVIGDAGYSSLFHTNFSYDEFKQTQAAFDTAKATLEAPGKIEDRPTYVVSLTPTASERSPYTRSRVWIDQKTCVALRADFYSGNAIRKQLTVPISGLQQLDGHWFPREIRMHDLMENTTTTLRVTNVSMGGDLPERYFNPRTYYTAD